MPVERNILSRNGAASPKDGVYYPKASYADEPYFQEINGEMHFLMQPWMKSIVFDGDAYDWNSNENLLQDVYFAPPKDTAAGWNVGDKITLRFAMDFSSTDLIYFGWGDEMVYFDNLTIGGDNQQIVDGQYETDYQYGLFEYYPLETRNKYNTFEFNKQASYPSAEASYDYYVSDINLKSYVLPNAGVDVYDVVYPY